MTDNKNILKVLNGFLKLSDNEKSILAKEVRDYLQADNFDKLNKKSLVESKMIVGPTGTDHCPCCGKS